MQCRPHPHLLALPALIGLSLLATSVFAHPYVFRLDGPLSVDSGARSGSAHSLRFAVHIDPNHTNWIAWSLANKVIDREGVSEIGSLEGGQAGVRGQIEVSIVSPMGKRSGPYVLDAEDEAGNPTGPQAVIFGREHLTPEVVRADGAGREVKLIETGVANDFIRDSGVGYYVFEFDFSGTPDQGLAYDSLYLIMDVRDGFDLGPPRAGGQRTGLGGYLYGNTHDDGDDGGNGDHDEDGSGPFPPPPPPPPFDGPITLPTLPPGGDDPGDPFFNDGRLSPYRMPESFRDPVDPVVPEPLTVGLVAGGLALLGAARRRRP